MSVRLKLKATSAWTRSPISPASNHSYDALLRIDARRAEAAFPQVFAPDAPDALADDWDEDEDQA